MRLLLWESLRISLSLYCIFLLIQRRNWQYLTLNHVLEFSFGLCVHVSFCFFSFRGGLLSFVLWYPLSLHGVSGSLLSRQQQQQIQEFEMFSTFLRDEEMFSTDEFIVLWRNIKPKKRKEKLIEIMKQLMVEVAVR